MSVLFFKFLFSKHKKRTSLPDPFLYPKEDLYPRKVLVS